jgi:hypothetical protein
MNNTAVTNTDGINALVLVEMISPMAKVIKTKEKAIMMSIFINIPPYIIDG